MGRSVRLALCVTTVESVTELKAAVSEGVRMAGSSITLDWAAKLAAAVSEVLRMAGSSITLDWEARHCSRRKCSFRYFLNA